MFLQEGPEGAGPPPHVHAWDESYYVLEGAIEVLSGDHMQTVKEGEFMFVPGGTAHMFRIKTAWARFLSFNSGGGAAAFFRDIDRTVGDTLDIATTIATFDKVRAAVFVGAALRWAEHRLADAPIARDHGGFLVAICQKRS